MAESVATYVLDSYALFAHFQAEPAGQFVQELLESARDDQVRLALSLISVGEIYYIASREQGEPRAKELVQDLRELPIQLYEATEERILAAARIKAKYAISYADAFAVGLAQELDAALVTGDPEFKKIDSLVQLIWLENKSEQK